MKTVLQGLIEELEERKAFLHNTDCISESLEVDYVITLCEKRLEHDKRQIEEAIEDGYFGCCGKKTTVKLKGNFWEREESWNERKSVNVIIEMCEKEKASDAYSLLPAVLLDDKGFPTEEWLQYVQSYKPDESLPLLTFVEMVLIDGWYMSDWGFKLHRKYKGKRKLELHTGGWSGNEEIIAAIKSNIWLTHFQMRYVMWKTGGHYYFELSVD